MEATETCRLQQRELDMLRDKASRAKFLESIVESVDAHIGKTMHGVRQAFKHVSKQKRDMEKLAEEVNGEMERLEAFVKHLGVVVSAYQSPIKQQQQLLL